MPRRVCPVAVALLLSMSLIGVPVSPSDRPVMAGEEQEAEALDLVAPLELTSSILVPRTRFIPSAVDLSRPGVDRMPNGTSSDSLPSKWDWREHGAVTSVKDQGHCRSSYAFAAVAVFESRLLVDGADAYDLSENSAKECYWEPLTGYVAPWGQAEGSCNGGNPLDVLDIFSQSGTVLETCDAYRDQDVPCKTDCLYHQTLLGWSMISQEDPPDVEVLKSYIKDYGPVMCAMYEGYGDQWETEFKGYDGSYTLYHPETQLANHAVLIVGWDDNCSHAGGRGAWIVKNSWGTNWGGPCGYGNEGGYFTIAYGSATIGSYAAFVTEWQDYDSNGHLMYYDEAGPTSGLPGTSTAWGLCRFSPAEDTWVTHVEFFTQGVDNSVDVYIYDDFDGAALSGQLFRATGLSYVGAGYHSIPVTPPLRVRSGDEVSAVVKFSTPGFDYPIPFDSRGPHETGRTYFSITGLDGPWTDAGIMDGDVCIRLRTSGMGLTPTPTRTLTLVPTRTSTPSNTQTATSTETPYLRAYLPVVLRDFEASGLDAESLP